jgi:predicted CDP-diglyceride synthetase/phosphatidate cytidylyltransferase
VIACGFLLVGPIFLWLYFSGAPTRRGNPVMGLVAGILLTALGFLGILVLGSMRRKSGRKWGRNDPRRLP